MNNNVTRATNYLVKAAMLSAIAVIFMYFDFPVLPTVPFLKIDFSDVPALIGGFALGPLAGVIIEAFKIFLIFLIKGSGTGGVGEFANFIIGVSFIFPASFIYQRRRNIKSALIGMIISTLSMSLAGVIANYYVLIPLYLKSAPSYEMMMYGIVPFNLIKGVMVSASTLAIYKKVSPIIQKENLLRSKKLA
ncbi:ECF transporter S component [Clostridium polynesiense]|uniref:ECF transporter S component n=1 Tax=Clostridium polynesiense TaxID=1325933 RepID=UPI00058C83D4|nr:ECF transporter S component [Clostridium polynesiense]